MQFCSCVSHWNAALIYQSILYMLQHTLPPYCGNSQHPGTKAKWLQAVQLHIVKNPVHVWR